MSQESMPQKRSTIRTLTAAPTRALTGLVIAVALTASACGSDSAESASTTVETGGVTVDGAWARMSPAMVENGAAYMTLTSGADDTLLGASVDPSIASAAEIHEVVAAEADGMTHNSMTEDSMSHDDMAEMPMTMREVESIELSSGHAVIFEPGGYHIMLLGLAAPLEDGSSFDLTLDFAEAGEKTVTIAVMAEAP